MRLSVGDKVDVTVDALPSSRYAGRIQQVGPIAASTGQYFPVVVSLKNDGRLLAGMTAKASFITTGGPGIIIPLNAVAGNEDGHADVFVMAQPGRALVPGVDGETAAARQLRQCACPEEGDHGLHRHQQPEPAHIRLDRHRRKHHAQDSQM